MRSAPEWFDLYAASHKNPVNKAIHWVCIPLIVVSTLGLLQAIPHPFPAPLHWGVVVATLSMFFYASLSRTLLVGMAAGALAALGINAAIASAGLSIGIVSGTVFAAAWVAQFIGHKIEGKKPSFFQDLQFLLVGPAWLLQFVYQRVGIPVVTAQSGV